MELELRKHKKLRQQKVNVQNGLTVLVGTNGSGKSSFLERLFFDNILGNITNQTPFANCVVYSSGVNESFSPLYQKHINVLYQKSLQIVSDHQSGELNLKGKYYFSKEWVPFLLLVSIFFAKANSNVTKWMNHFSIKAVTFDFEVYLPSAFRSKLKQANKNIEEGRADYGFESSQLVKFLNSLCGVQLDEILTQSKVKLSWGSREQIESNPNSVLSAALYRQLFDSGLFASIDQTINPVNKFFQMMQVISSGGTRSKFIPLEKAKITFNREGQLIEINDLSDGEFQILLNSALLDLFDAQNSLFLLDEIDAHIHPTIIKDIWSSFDNINGFAFTTSHNLLTISNTNYNRIIFLEDGTIISDLARKVTLVDDICGTLFGGPVFKSVLNSIEHIVLIDDYNDWEIFKSLMKKKGKDFSKLESRLLIFKKPSGTSRNDRPTLIKSKMDFVDELKKVAEDAKVNPDQVRMKNVFLLCDSDSYISNAEGLDISTINLTIRTKKIAVHSIIWNRRYIESYLISPTARTHYDNVSSENFSWGELDEFGNIVETILNETNRKRIKCKSVIRSFIESGDGFDCNLMNEYVSRMSCDEIDPYLELVFNKIVEIIS